MCYIINKKLNKYMYNPNRIHLLVWRNTSSWSIHTSFKSLSTLSFFTNATTYLPRDAGSASLLQIKHTSSTKIKTKGKMPMEQPSTQKTISQFLTKKYCHFHYFTFLTLSGQSLELCQRKNKILMTLLDDALSSHNTVKTIIPQFVVG